jgi:hypothetical protein
VRNDLIFFVIATALLMAVSVYSMPTDKIRKKAYFKETLRNFNNYKSVHSFLGSSR